MSSTVFYERFNEQAYDFMKELCTSFPQFSEFNRCKTALNVLKNVNTKAPQKFFHSYIGSVYKDVLLKKDENFFLSEDKFGIKEDNQYWFDFIQQLKNIWRTLDETNKNVIWEYFHVLILLSDKCTFV